MSDTNENEMVGTVNGEGDKGNPYEDNETYKKLFAFVQEAGIVTRIQILDHLINVLGIVKAKAVNIATVILSPRLESQSRGDCRGSVSAKGHLYYMEKLPKTFQGEPQKFRFGFRDVPLAPYKVGKVAAEKTASPEAAKATAEAPQTLVVE